MPFCRRATLRIACSAVLLLALPLPAHAEILRVDSQAAPGGDGSTWVYAFDTLQDALDAAEPGDEVWVAVGTYRPDQGASQVPGSRGATFDLPDGVAVYGGFAGFESTLAERAELFDLTELSGDLGSGLRSFHVVTANGVSALTRLDGFVIRDGSADGVGADDDGAGMQILALSRVIVANCTFTANMADGDGGGVWITSSSSPTFEDCVWIANAAGGRGGGMRCDQADLVEILSGVFESNSANSNGGGLSSDGGPLRLVAPIVRGNTTNGSGGGIYSDGQPGACTLLGGLVTENTSGSSGGGAFLNPGYVQDTQWTSNAASRGGAVYMSGSISRGTVHSNAATSEGGGLFVLAASTVTSVDIVSNTAETRGGGIRFSGESSMSGCTLDENLAVQSGGGLYTTSQVDVVQTSFTANSAQDGGGAYGGSRYTDCDFDRNTAEDDGGGLFWTSNLSTIVGCRFTSNQTALVSDAKGGAIWISSSSGTIRGSTFISNQAGEGGAIASNISFTAFGCELRSNKAFASGGGAIRCGAGTTLDSTTLSLNTAVGNGGAIYQSGNGNIMLRYCTLSDNASAMSGGAIGPAPSSTPGLTAEHTTFERNRAGIGGAIWNSNAGSYRLTDCTFVQNEATSGIGGAIRLSGSNPTMQVTRCAFRQNASAGDGGAFHWTPGSGNLFPFVDCLFELNSAGGRAGALETGTNGTIRLERCTFHQNTAIGDAGAAYIRNTHEIVECRFEENQANANAGGARIGNGVNGYVRDTVFQENTAGLDGGGAQIESVLAGCVFDRNVAGGQGGAAYLSGFTSAVYPIGNCSFFGNEATQNGGAISGRRPYLYNCDFVGNSSSDANGGAVAFDSGSPRVAQCTFAGNTAPMGSGGGVFVTATASLAIDNSILWNNSDSGGIDTTAQVHEDTGTAVILHSCVNGIATGDGNDNVDSDPLFVDTDGPDDVLGTIDDDTRLLTGSPCFSAGDDALIPDDLADVDYDGSTLLPVPIDRDVLMRIEEFPSGSTSVDMGAFEARPFCNDGNIPDAEVIGDGSEADCDGNHIPDICEGTPPPEEDCNGDGTPDACELENNDCNGNGIPDNCEADCNGNDVADDCDLRDGTSLDCNDNGAPDECDISAMPSLDCNANGVLDSCETDNGATPDCNGNGTPDECEGGDDCNQNGRLDSCDITSGSSLDCDGNGIPDECDIASDPTKDCNGNGVPDSCDIASGFSLDCDTNGKPDECDIASGEAQDCNGNGVADSCDIESGFSLDCDTNGTPDECDDDCNGNGIPDSCDIANGTSFDCNANMKPDECDIASGMVEDCNRDGIPDTCVEPMITITGAWSPASAPTTGGTTIVIEGTGFSTGMYVRFENTFHEVEVDPADVTFNSSAGQLEVVVPPFPPGCGCAPGTSFSVNVFFGNDCNENEVDSTTFQYDVAHQDISFGVDVQAAIDAAPPGTCLILQSSLGDFHAGPLRIGPEKWGLTVRGGDLSDPGATLIVGESDGLTPPADPVLSLDGHGPGICIEAVNVILGNTGIDIRGGVDPVILNCVVDNNVADETRGGGITVLGDSHPLVVGCRVNTNLTLGDGGGLLVRESGGAYVDLSISGNASTGPGGGLHLVDTGTDFALIDTLVGSNIAAPHGGGIYWTGLSEGDLIRNTVWGNEVEGNGAGIFLDLDVKTHRFANNLVRSNFGTSTSSMGGGLYVEELNLNLLDICGNAFHDNQAQFGGAIAFRKKNRVIFERNLVFCNRAFQNAGDDADPEPPYYAGGLFLRDMSPRFARNTIYRNTGAGGEIEEGVRVAPLDQSGSIHFELPGFGSPRLYDNILDRGTGWELFFDVPFPSGNIVDYNLAADGDDPDGSFFTPTVLNPGSNNILGQDPVFVDAPETCDFNGSLADAFAAFALAPGSPGEGAASDTMTDIGAVPSGTAQPSDCIVETIGDCNANGIPDIVDMLRGDLGDGNNNRIPDECEGASKPGGSQSRLNSLIQSPSSR